MHKDIPGRIQEKCFLVDTWESRNGNLGARIRKDIFVLHFIAFNFLLSIHYG